jgi:hypothetical protein
LYTGRKALWMKKISVILQVRPDWYAKELIPLEWQAYPSETPGLVVCRSPTPNKESTSGFSPSPFTWQVIHAGSGLPLPKCRYFATRKAALAMAKGLCCLANWELSGDVLIKLSGEALKAGKGWPQRFSEIKEAALIITTRRR